MDSFYDFVMGQDNDKSIDQSSWDVCAIGEYYKHLTGDTLTGFVSCSQDTWPNVFSGKVCESDPVLASGSSSYGELKDRLEDGDRGNYL